MKDYNYIINSYMKFFCCHLLEYCGIEDSGMCFDSVYSYLKNYEKNMKEVVYELHMPDICSKNVKDIVAFYNSAIDYLREKLRKKLQILDAKEKKLFIYWRHFRRSFMAESI